MNLRRAWERAAWVLISVVVAAWLALVEVFWLPLRIAGFLLPLSILMAVGGNLLLPATLHRLSGSRLVAVLPAVTWLVIVVAAMTRRPEGDLVLGGVGAGGVVSLIFLLLGVGAAAFSVGRILGAPRRPPVSPRRDGEPARRPAGSGSSGAR